MSDLYSLGAMLYEMLAGRPPFLGDDAVAVITQHLSTTPVAPSWHNAEVPPTVENLVLRLLAKDPADRPSSAKDVIDAIESISSRSFEMQDRVELTQANPLDRLASGVFVGRESEMNELKHLLDEAISGRSHLVMIVGEPGIGKTRTSEELATYARLKGAQVLVGRCYEGEGAPAYWPWIQIIRSYVNELSSETVASEMGSGAPDIAAIVSEVRQKLPDLASPATADPEEARFRLFDSVAMFLANASRKQPLTILLDDLHWADKPSLLLMQFLARELRGSRVLGVGTYRDVELGRHHPLSQTLAELSRGDVRRVLLRGLSQSDVERFIEVSAGIDVPSGLAAAVFKETEGNPFFVAETVRLLLSEGKLDSSPTSSSWSVSIPQGVREVVGRRLDRLSEQANEVLTVASVIGRDFSISVLEAASEATKDGILEALEEAVADRVIVEGEGLGRYRFSHALVRETLYEDLATTRRIRSHLKVGEVLEDLYGASDGSHISELAFHFFESATVGDPRKAIEYCRNAARRASSMTAYEEAASQYDKALQVYELLNPPEPELRADLLLDHASELTHSGETARARDVWARAADAARDLGDANRLAVAALGSGEVWVSAGWAEEDLIALLEEALAAQVDEDCSERALLLGRLGEALRFTDRRPEEATLSEQAVEMAKRLKDESVLVKTLWWRSIALGGPKRTDERYRVAKALVDVAQRLGDLKYQALGLRVLANVNMVMGDREGSEICLEQHEAVVLRLRQPLFTWFVPFLRSGIEYLDGDLEAMKALGDEALRIATSAGEPNISAFIMPMTWLISRETGLEDSPLPALDPSMYFGVTSSLMGSYLRGDIARARDEFDAFMAGPMDTLPLDWAWTWWMTDLAELASWFEDEQAAARLYELLKPFEGEFVVAVQTVCRGSVDHYLGMLAGAQGRFDIALDHFDNAQTLNARLRAKTLEAHTSLEKASVFSKRKAQGDDRRVIDLTNAVIDIGRHTGQKSLVARAVELKLLVQGTDRDSMGRSMHVVAAAVEEEKPDILSHASPDGTVTIMFSDIENSTQLTETVGDHRWLEVLRDHNEVIRRQVSAHSGFEVKSSGDGFMVVFSSARSALKCAIDIQRDLDRFTAADRDVPIRVRIGLHSGEAMKEQGDFFGRHVNLAARVGAQALGGQILVSSLTRALVSGSADFRFSSAREVELKGVTEPQMVYQLDWLEPQTQPS
ncbi:MAG: AAA family ATPase [Actinobacteria bacterium]|nr:AAA family ATPase [Actinomycetota bacterium]